jgi:alkanesulfonate monooxygenase SsuD/methylene tetrahydromethanopterin reductase-like flavin-dependent oxidoreductase (luciferase family)
MHVDIALEPEFTASELAELGALAERAGITTLWVTNDPQARDLFGLYPKVAEATRKIRLGVMALAPFEMHPLRMAAALQTLNELSSGRAAIIVGGGGAILAHSKFDLSRRVRAVRECIDILKQAGAAKPLNYQGEIYPVWRFRQRWAVQPAPTVLAGANADQMLRMSAHAADGLHMSDMPLSLTPGAVSKVSEALVKNGRAVDAFEFNNFWAFHVKADRRAAEMEARSRLILRGMLHPRYIEPFLDEAEVKLVRDNIQSFYKPFWDQQGFYAGDGEFDGVPPAVVQKLLDGLTLTASADELDTHMEVLHDFARAGLTHITLGLHDNPADAIRLIGERVVPALRDA